MKQSRFVRNIWLGIENLLLHKLRSFLTMLGVVFGVGSVVAMLAVGEGASKEALYQIQKLGSNNIIINSVKSLEEESTSTQHSFMSVYGLTYLDYDRISGSFSNIRQVAPAKLIRKESRLGSNILELRIVGTTQKWFELVPRQITVVGAAEVLVLPRAKPGNPGTPMVCHLLNQGYVPDTDSMAPKREFAITVADSLFGAPIARATLLAPGAERAELTVRRLPGASEINVPALDLWAVLKLTCR